MSKRDMMKFIDLLNTVEGKILKKDSAELVKLEKLTEGAIRWGRNTLCSEPVAELTEAGVAFTAEEAALMENHDFCLSAISFDDGEDYVWFIEHPDTGEQIVVRECDYPIALLEMIRNTAPVAV